MTVPKFDEIRIEALDLLSSGDPIRLRDFEQPLAQAFALADEEVAQEYESGNGKVFYDRISWALSYLYMAGLVERPRRGVYQITQLGRDMLAGDDDINDFVSQAVAARETPKQGAQLESAATTQNRTPQEELYESADTIRKAVHEEIIDIVLSKSPREFEKLVVSLLQRMGYGGEVHDAGEVTNYTNDGGIDGIIREDVLGLGRIHIQAKKYARGNSVGRDAIQSFVGALATAQSNKGVFITTSSFSGPAIEYSEYLHGSTTLVLIDGDRLAGLIYDYGLGMQVEQTIELKKLDSDFWDSMEDDQAQTAAE
jgi:restriction system protein